MAWFSDLPPDIVFGPWVLALLGLAVGSFLNVVIYRLPLILERQWWSDVAAQLGDRDSFRRVFSAEASAGVTQAGAALQKTLALLKPFSIARPRSRCPACSHRIRWYENIPVASWIALRRRCSACGTPIPLRYPLVEAGVAVLFALLSLRLGAHGSTLLWCGFAAALVALAMIDWDTTVLPDAVTLPLLWAGICAAAFGWLSPLTLQGSIEGTVVGWLSLWAVYWLFKLATGKEGMGYGDFKLLAALGAWLGWQAILPIVLFASVLGAIVGIGMKVTGSLREGRFVPFGPFLAGGGAAVLLVGLPTLLGWLGWA